jgi:polyhydroxyalkanoate synthase subunit PhaC
MIPMFPLALSSEEVMQQLIDMSQRAADGVKALSQVREDAVGYGIMPKTAIYRDHLITLYHYQPRVPKPIQPPVLIVYALVNRPYMIDLQEDRSMVRGLLELGLDVYLIDWGYPQRSDRWTTLDDYINGHLHDCVQFLLHTLHLEQINVIGICQGGVLSLCYAALNPGKIANLVTMVTPVDFHVVDGLLNLWMGASGGKPTIDPEAMVEALGNIPGDVMNFGFLMLKPFELGLQKYLSLLDTWDDTAHSTNFLRMEKWIFDCPDQAGAAWAEFVRHFYIENGLIRREISVGGRCVDLKSITVPILNLYAEKDHLVPPSSSQALRTAVSSSDYTEVSYPVGHIGMYVSAKVQTLLPPTIVEWLKARTESTL